MDNILNITPAEHQLRLAKVREALANLGISAALISSNANKYYLTGRVFSGYIYIPAVGKAAFLIKRPVHLVGDGVINIRKPELIPQALADAGFALDANPAMELSALTYAMAMRLKEALSVSTLVDCSAALSSARAAKTDREVELIRLSGVKHESVYRRIPSLYMPGMSDIELQIEIERLSRLEGCLGQFRIAGEEMELYMGNVLCGDNADAPSPYDFAMGGAGADPSLPVGANGAIIRRGNSVMVDMNGNFTGYMTDMTRCFYLGEISDEARAAHNLSIDICHAIAQHGLPGTPARDLYDLAHQMASDAGLAPYFMGHRQKAGFVGHGIGIEINELPVLAPRSRDILRAGNVIAVEPKFVIPGTGAVGIENSYLVRENLAMECLTNAPEQLINLD